MVSYELVSTAIREAKQAGLSHFVVVVSQSQLPFLARDLSRLEGVETRVVVQNPVSGFGHAVAIARDEIPDKGAVAVLTADERVDPSCLKSMLALYQETLLSVVSARELTKEVTQDFGRMSLSEADGGGWEVKSIVEKPGVPTPGLEFIPVGRYILSPECLDALADIPVNKKTRKKELTDAIQAILIRGVRVRAHLLQGEPESFNSPMLVVKDVLNRLAKQADNTAKSADASADRD